MRALGMLLGGAIALAACTPPPPPPDLSNGMLAPGYLAQAASIDMFEVQSGQLAFQASQNPAVVNFANMIVRDHTTSTQMLMAAAQSAGIAPPPPVMLPEQQAMLDQLRAAGTGYNFDSVFKQEQIIAHESALALHHGYAQGGDVPALRATAGQIVPVVQSHLAHAQALMVTPPPPHPAPVTTPPAGERGERGR
jgi:putative membrane protein